MLLAAWCTHTHALSDMAADPLPDLDITYHCAFAPGKAAISPKAVTFAKTTDSGINIADSNILQPPLIKQATDQGTCTARCCAIIASCRATHRQPSAANHTETTYTLQEQGWGHHAYLDTTRLVQQVRQAVAAELQHPSSLACVKHVGNIDAEVTLQPLDIAVGTMQDLHDLQADSTCLP